MRKTARKDQSILNSFKYLQLLIGYSVKTQMFPSSKNKQTKKYEKQSSFAKISGGGLTVGESQQCDEHPMRTPTQS